MSTLKKTKNMHKEGSMLSTQARTYRATWESETHEKLGA